MKVRLVLERKRKRVWATQLRRSEATLGRALSCTIRIPSAVVSRLHCRLRIDKGVVTVEDLESVNGTFVNGARVRGIQIVHPGDRLSVGPVTFVVEYELTAQALRRLGGEEAYPVVEAGDEIEIIEDAGSQSEINSLPLAEPLEKLEDAEMVILDDKEEMDLPEGGDLRDFLIELDDTDDRST